MVTVSLDGITVPVTTTPTSTVQSCYCRGRTLMSPCLNGETAARGLTLTSTGGGSSSDMQRSPLYLVGCGWVGEDFQAPRSGASLKHLGVHGVFCDAPEKTNAKTRAASIPKALGTECMLRQMPECISKVGPVQVDAYRVFSPVHLPSAFPSL